MKTQLLTSLALLAVAALAPRPAAAQNMNQMIQNQINMQRMGDQMAAAVMAFEVAWKRFIALAIVVVRKVEHAQCDPVHRVAPDQAQDADGRTHAIEEQIHRRTIQSTATAGPGGK